jgi:hypothetical protein
VFEARWVSCGVPCETLPLRSQYTLMSQLSGHRSRKCYGIAKRKKNRWQSAVRWRGTHAGPSFLQFKMPCLCAKFCGPAVRAIGFRKADGISGPAQKNNPKAVVLIERARRIKFDDVTVTDFAMRQASASSRRRGAHLISVSGDSADEDGQAERAGDPARLRWQ